MASRTAKRHRMRCGVERCRARFTLKKHPGLYKRPVKCPVCGDSLKVRHVEEERRRELAKQITCNCGGYPFPHRQGSMRACVHHPLAGRDFTEQELLDYDACLATDRGG